MDFQVNSKVYAHANCIRLHVDWSGYNFVPQNSSIQDGGAEKGLARWTQKELLSQRNVINAPANEMRHLHTELALYFNLPIIRYIIYPPRCYINV